VISGRSQGSPAQGFVRVQDSVRFKEILEVQEIVGVQKTEEPR
jgi:hypothetical protein